MYLLTKNMGIIDRIKAFLPEQLQTKGSAANFNVTNISTWNDYEVLTRSTNYLDQYFGWTYKASKTKSDSIVQFLPKMYRRKKGKVKEDEDEELTPDNNDLLRDLFHFNPYQTLREALKIKQLHLDLVGLHFWLIKVSQDKRYRYEFYILDPQRISQISNNLGLPIAYRYQDVVGGFHTIDAKDIIIFREPNPKNWLLGTSPLQASRYAHNTMELAEKYNMNMFGNMGRPDGLLFFDQISEIERKKVEKMLRQKYQGVNNARKTGIVNIEPKWIEMSKNQVDLDFVEGSKLMRDEILGIHGVPKPLVGLTDSTYTNSQEAQRIYQQYTLKPLLDNQDSALTEQLIPKYYDGMKLEISGLYFESDDPVEADKKVDAEVLKANTESATLQWNNGLSTFNQVQLLIGNPVTKSGDIYKPVPVAPSTPIDNTKSIAQKANDGEDRVKLKSFFLDKSLKDEKSFVEVMKGYFKDQEARVLSATKSLESKKASLKFNTKKEAEIAVETFAAIYAKMGEDYNKLANDLTKGNIPLSDETRDQINKNLEKFSIEINETTKSQLQQLIADAVQNNYGLEQTQNLVKELFDKWMNGNEEISVTRSEAIARTEVNSIKNMVFRSNYFRNDHVESIEWLSAHDKDTRNLAAGDEFDHVAMDGVITERGVKFRVPGAKGGEYLEYPGDKSGSPADVINCRCTTVPNIRT